MHGAARSAVWGLQWGQVEWRLLHDASFLQQICFNGCAHYLAGEVKLQHQVLAVPTQWFANGSWLVALGD